MEKNQIGNSRTNLKLYKQQLFKLTKKQKEIAIGVLLGDGCLQTQNKGKTFRLKFEQSFKHKDYIDHLFEIFDPWILSNPKLVTRINKNKNIVKTFQLQTFSHIAFNELAELFLDFNFKKSINTNIEKNFTSQSLAYWFMDDGGKLDYTVNKGKAIVLNTHNFSLNEVNFLKTMLINKFKLKCWIKLNKQKPIIVISGYSYEKVITLIKPFIIPSMIYKLPNKRLKS